MRTVDQPEVQVLGKKIVRPSPEPVSKEPMWKPLDGNPGYMKSTDGRVKKNGCDYNIPVTVLIDLVLGLGEVDLEVQIPLDSGSTEYTLPSPFGVS